MSRRILPLIAALAAAGTLTSAQNRTAALPSPLLEQYLEALRQQAGIPGMSAAVVQDEAIVWEHAFGFQDQETRIRATPDTPYAVGGMSQIVASVLLLQCVEQRHLELDAPVRNYRLTLPEPGATLRQVLAHTSRAPSGSTYQFAPDRFGQLDGVMESCAPQPYRKSVAHRILEFLAMIDSVPGSDLRDRSILPEGLFDPAALDRYDRVLARIAVPYKVDKKGRASRNESLGPERLSAASGLISTVRDLARFDVALDSGRLLLEETRAAAWSNAPGDGAPVPTGLGWFVQTYRGEPVVWQFGQIDDAYGSLIVKLPTRRTTFILLANSSALNSPFDLQAGDVTRSLFATLFLRLFL